MCGFWYFEHPSYPLPGFFSDFALSILTVLFVLDEISLNYYGVCSIKNSSIIYLYYLMVSGNLEIIYFEKISITKKIIFIFWFFNFFIGVS